MRIFVTTVFMAALMLVLFAQNSEAQFKKGGLYLGPNITLATDPMGFGAELEYGISPNVGIGGMVRYWGGSDDYAYYKYTWSVIIPQFVAYYHFMPGEALDPYLGGRLGYAIASSSFEDKGLGIPYQSTSAESSLFLHIGGGLRYFFSPKISINGSGELRIAGEKYFGDSSLGLVVGVDFTL